MSAYGKMGRQYYAGDPGLGGFLKKVGGAVAKTALGFLPGGNIIRTVGGAVIGGAIGRATAGPQVPALPVPPGGAAPPFQVGPVRVNLPFAGPPGVGVQLGSMGPAQGPPPRGYKLNKSSYFLRDGTFVEAGTRYVRIRRRNPLNPRAADRAISRIASAKRAAGMLSRVSIRKDCKRA